MSYGNIGLLEREERDMQCYLSRLPKEQKDKIKDISSFEGALNDPLLFVKYSFEQRVKLLRTIAQLEVKRIGKILAYPITDLETNVRTFNVLSRHFSTVGDVISNTERQLLKLDGFGKSCLNNLKKALNDEYMYGVYLGMNPNDYK